MGAWCLDIGGNAGWDGGDTDGCAGWGGDAYDIPVSQGVSILPRSDNIWI